MQPQLLPVHDHRQVVHGVRHRPAGRSPLDQHPADAQAGQLGRVVGGRGRPSGPGVLPLDGDPADEERVVGHHGAGQPARRRVQLRAVVVPAERPVRAERQDEDVPVPIGERLAHPLPVLRVVDRPEPSADAPGQVGQRHDRYRDESGEHHAAEHAGAPTRGDHRGDAAGAEPGTRGQGQRPPGGPLLAVAQQPGAGYPPHGRLDQLGRPREHSGTGEQHPCPTQGEESPGGRGADLAGSPAGDGDRHQHQGQHRGEHRGAAAGHCAGVPESTGSQYREHRPGPVLAAGGEGGHACGVRRPTPRMEDAGDDPGQRQHQDATAGEQEAGPADEHQDQAPGQQRPRRRQRRRGAGHEQPRERSRCAGAHAQRGPRDPRQRGVGHEQGPVADQQPLGDVGAPAVDQAGHQPRRAPSTVRPRRDQPCGAEHRAVHGRDQHQLLQPVPGQHAGDQSHDGIDGDGARQRSAQPQRVEVEVLARDEHHVPEQHETGRQRGSGDQQGDDQGQDPRRPRPRVGAGPAFVHLLRFSRRDTPMPGVPADLRRVRG
ncbi:hypothetical protein DQ237_02120 [Blastococcus sp. TF02-8]|nr:hypothetical protein DQ237_02120 [Blastococcus sp. TF02-8]